MPTPAASSQLAVRPLASAVFLLFLALVCPGASGAEGATRNVILITTDGFRWQEMFTGAEEALMTTNAALKKVDELKELKRQFWRPTPQQRREALLPFIWETIARQGQLWGNTNLESTVKVTNPFKFSYPGYNELLTGVADPRIDSNDKRPNPNTNVLEWLHGRPAYRGRCAAFASWDVIPFILNRDRNGLFVRAGIEPLAIGKLTPRQSLLNDLVNDVTPLWDGLLHDGLLFQGAFDYLREHKPRVFYMAFDETDDWAHDGRYERYLQAAHRVDNRVRKVWEFVQSESAYRNKTTLLLTTDHGRGSGPKRWRDHGKDVAGAEYIWLAVLGPDTPSLGERSHTPPIQQNQVAATVAAFLGQDFTQGNPAAGKPILELMRR
jgi:hypothetical protein